MCGIAGSYIKDNRAGAGGTMREALRTMAHRGPDDEGIHVSGRTVLGHRRLSIIDTSGAGHQPFTDEGGRYTIVFNGEVFNFLDLRAELEAKGHSFRSRTDTEVILRLFVVEGPSFLHRLNGFFALAIHDAVEDSLLIARDRFGVKPLLWTERGGTLSFASELRALVELGADRSLDPASLEQLLIHQYIPAPSTILRSVHELEPGHVLKVDADGVEEEVWYDVVDAVRTAPVPTDPEQQLFALLEDAVRIRLVADVPVGCFLSGGVDSSIVSALAAKHHPDLHTFSIGYAQDPFFDETAYAEEVASHIRSKHTTFKLTREDLAEGYLQLLDAMDAPFTDSSALASFILCQRTRGTVTVALSGDGADELFGGYRKHQAELRARDPGVIERVVNALGPFWRAMPRSRDSVWLDRFRQLDRFARLARCSPEERFIELASFTPREVARRLLHTPADRAVMEERMRRYSAPLQRMEGLNGALLGDVMRTLPDNMLHKVDLTSMAHGLEVRTPFLDRRVVELAFTLPARTKFHKGSGKDLLRRTFRTLVPPSVMARPKKGFEVPLLELLRGPLTPLVDDLFRRDLLEAAGVDPAAALEVLARMRSSSPANAQATVHALTVYLAWWRRHAG